MQERGQLAGDRRQTALTQSSEDLELIRRALARQQGAIEELGSRLSCVPRLVGAACRRMGTRLSQEEQADLVQDVVLLLWQKLETFEGRSTLEGWAWTFAHFQTRNHVRGAARHRREAQLDLEQQPEPPMPAPEPNILDRETLEGVLTSLPDEMAQAIRLKHFEGLKFRQIAEQLQMSENTAKTRYYRGLARARVILAEMRGGETSE